MRTLLVFNSQAHAGRAGKALPAVVSRLERLGSVDVAQTECAGDATAKIKSAPLSEYDAVVCAGGDGTLFETVNGILAHAPGTRPPLGILPLGTGNAFARDLGLEGGDLEGAVAMIARGESRRVDVAEVNAAGDSFHFVNVMGLGFAVAAGRRSQALKWLGRSAYTVATLLETVRLRQYPMRMVIDGRAVEETQLLVSVCNSRYTGTRFLIAPDAAIDDGLLDVVCVRPLSRARLLRLFPTIYQGRHVDYPEVQLRRAGTLRIEAPVAMELAPDGEFRGNTPVEISCQPGMLEVFASP